MPVLPARPGPLDVLVGVLRYATVLLLLLGGSAVMLLARLAPVRVRRVPVAVWVAVGLCRLFLRVTGVLLTVDHPERIRRHEGFLFFNHLTFIDGIVVMAVAPVRFLSMAEVQWIPFLGAMARAIGTIFVKRSHPRSRAAAREALREAVVASPMPVALAPEGKIGSGGGVLPLRPGSFRVAAEAEAPILLVALQFEPLTYGAWPEGEWITHPLWRLCARTAPFAARVTPLDPPLNPTPTTPAALAEEAAARFNTLLGSEREASIINDAHEQRSLHQSDPNRAP